MTILPLDTQEANYCASIINQLISSEKVIACGDIHWFRLDTVVRARCTVEIFDCHVYDFIGNSDTSVLLLFKVHFYYRILGQVYNLIVSVPGLCPLYNLYLLACQFRCDVLTL